MRGRIHRALFIAALAVLAAREARANDGAAGLDAGELVFKHLDGVRMESEDLFISEKEVRVRYLFRNTTDHDIESVVAFPLPPIPAKDDSVCTFEDADWSESYDPCSDNPLGFALTIDGQTASFHTERKPLPPDPKYPGWRKASVTHYWTQRFPAGKSVVIEHSYKPAEGIVWVNDYADSRFRLRRDFCVGTSTHKSLFDILRTKHSAPTAFHFDNKAQTRSIKYILKTARTWDGPIGRLHLTIEKSSPRDFVSVCLDGLRKTSPTRYELVATDYVPQSDLSILFVDLT
jgi:hypothetical protein